MGLFFCLLTPILSLRAEEAPDPSYGLNDTMAQGQLSQAFSATDPRVRVGQIIGIILSFIGIIFLVLMIYAGITWMTAAGNDQQVSKAKDLMINAIIGLIIVFAAYAITAYIGNILTNSGT